MVPAQTPALDCARSTNLVRNAFDRGLPFPWKAYGS